MSTSSQNRDPALQQPPWQQPVPEGPGNAVTLDEVLEMPVLPGPASNSGAPAHNPMSIEAPNIDPGGSLLAENLNWKA